MQVYKPITLLRYNNEFSEKYQAVAVMASAPHFVVKAPIEDMILIDDDTKYDWYVVDERLGDIPCTLKSFYDTENYCYAQFEFKKEGISFMRELLDVGVVGYRGVEFWHDQFIQHPAMLEH